MVDLRSSSAESVFRAGQQQNKIQTGMWQARQQPSTVLSQPGAQTVAAAVHDSTACMSLIRCIVYSRESSTAMLEEE